MRAERLGGVDCLVSRGASSRAVVLCHGYGASMEDLAPLAPHLGGDAYDWYFPQGPVVLGPFGGRAWFPLDVEALEGFFRTGEMGFFESAPFRDGVERAPGQDGVLPQGPGALRGPYPGGGSPQGSSLSLALSLRGTDPRVDQLIVLSGLLVGEHLWGPTPEALGMERSFQSHGRSDPLIPYGEGERLAAYLTALNESHRFVPFEGGHGVPPEVVGEVRGFLRGGGRGI